ncbi:Uncharacterized protein At3g49140 [Linum grandiflorum]
MMTMAMIIEPVAASRFAAGANLRSSATSASKRFFFRPSFFLFSSSSSVDFFRDFVISPLKLSARSSIAFVRRALIMMFSLISSIPPSLKHSPRTFDPSLTSPELVEEALISLCWRCKGIRVEEAEAISVDSLGFDLRVCSGTQVQTLRFAFKTLATSEHSAESHSMIYCSQEAE